MFFKLICRNCSYLVGVKTVRLKKIPFNKQCLFSTSVAVNNTVKGWKIMARVGDRNAVNVRSELAKSCEEGTDAVPHSVLMNQLQNCSSHQLGHAVKYKALLGLLPVKLVREQIETFCSTMSLTPADVEKRKEFCNSLHELLSPYFPNFKLHIFGSSINGLGFKGCDADISIQTIFDGTDYSKPVKQVPSLDSVIQGETSPDVVAHMHPKNMLRFIRRILRTHHSDIREPMVFVKARCPLLRFYDSKYDIFCDFSCSNESSLRNTKLLQFITRLDERFVMLAKVTRYWGKYGGFVSDIDKFNSYAFSLLVVHFLQLTQPPVLPPIKEMIQKSEYLTHGDVNDDELLLKDLKTFKISKNCQPIEDLLREYFFYFLNFDFTNMMLPLTSSIIPVSSFTSDMTNSSDTFEFSPVVVQDPFRLNFNVTAGATFKNCRNYINAVIEACKVYQDKTVWDSNSDMWGLCALFHKPLYDNELKKEWSDNLIHTIKLPLKMKVGVVKEILHKGLLFECTEYNVRNEVEEPQPSLRLNCNVYYNTWQGRDWIQRKLQPSITDPLEVENWITKEILRNKVDTRKQILFTFLCECFERTSDNELNIVLTFRESKSISPALAVFLKEYIPDVYKKLCENC